MEAKINIRNMGMNAATKAKRQQQGLLNNPITFSYQKKGGQGPTFNTRGELYMHIYKTWPKFNHGVPNPQSWTLMIKSNPT
ncbi:MAG: hypothetical protein P4M12_06010 [Gammaproteobacteria bacterium]|nr:hypothetical protein [Gammaproteobacteria bacterium]